LNIESKSVSKPHKRVLQHNKSRKVTVLTADSEFDTNSIRQTSGLGNLKSECSE
jgi:hypothetical protein